MHISGKLSDSTKANIETKLANIDKDIIAKTKEHIFKLHEVCGCNEIFGRSVVEKVTGLKSTRRCSS